MSISTATYKFEITTHYLCANALAYFNVVNVSLQKNGES